MAGETIQKLVLRVLDDMVLEADEGQRSSSRGLAGSLAATALAPILGPTTIVRVDRGALVRWSREA